MKIERTLPQFQEEKALLIVAGEHVARFYAAASGRIEELEIFRIQNPQYTDREGFFKKTIGKQELGSGSVYEPKKRYMESKFFQKFREEIKRINRSYDFSTIYIFYPEFLSKEMERFLPKGHYQVRSRIMGNFIQEHPFKLLAKIKEEMAKREVEPVRGDVNKLLRKE